MEARPFLKMKKEIILSEYFFMFVFLIFGIIALMKDKGQAFTLFGIALMFAWNIEHLRVK